MFRRRDLPSVLFLITLITMLLITLCQILVVHKGEIKAQNDKENTFSKENRIKRKSRDIYAASSFRNFKIIARTELYRRYISKVILESQTKDLLPHRSYGRRYFSKNVITENSDNKATRKKSNSLLSTKGLCPAVPEYLHGNLSIEDCKTRLFRMKDVFLQNLDVQKGGVWKPANCTARHKVAIVIPYRNRLHHLVVLLYFLIPLLKRQMLHFRIFVTEQHGNDTFNKGRLMNAAFQEARALFDFDCVVFHDVDLVPENDKNMYSCPWQPKHLSVAIDEMNYRLKYELLVGGVLNMRKEHFQLVNGYSNNYWGWGAEDDDMAYRILLSGLRITRPPSTIARYKMLRHKKRKPAAWIERVKLLKTVNTRYQSDGLNNVPYKEIFIHQEKLFTHFMLNIGKAE